jgi:multidrug efflux pump subunit AcrB
MIPRLTDPFVGAMAVCIMFGLSFAAVLCLLMTPVLSAIFFGIHEEPPGRRKARITPPRSAGEGPRADASGPARAESSIILRDRRFADVESDSARPCQRCRG